MKTKLMTIATMAVLMLVAMALGQAQNAPMERSSSQPCLPSFHGLEDHQIAWCYFDQITALVTGTNWFSTYVDITLDDLKAALVAAMPNNNAAITIKSKAQNVKYQNGRWAGQLTVLDVAQMYMITVSEACEISLEGVLVNPSTLTLTITSGANWIAFPYNESMSVTDFYGSFPVNNDVVKSKFQNTRYSNGRWGGQLNTLIPGQGYIYNSAATGDRTFTFPTSAK